MIYVVTEGESPNYRIIRVFSTEKRAKKWVGMRPYKIEAFVCDDQTGAYKNQKEAGDSDEVHKQGRPSTTRI